MSAVPAGAAGPGSIAPGRGLADAHGAVPAGYSREKAVSRGQVVRWLRPQSSPKLLDAAKPLHLYFP